MFTAHSHLMHRSVSYIALGMFSLLLTACTQLGTTAANSIAYLCSDQVRHADLAYGEAEHQKLDIYTPPADAYSTPRPVILFVYGGSWQKGHKGMYAFAAEAFTSQGYIVAIADYAKYPPARYPRFTQDIARAYAWLENNIASYGGNASQFYLVGHSAGAHIAAMLASNPAFLEAAGSDRSNLKTFAGLSGPYDFEPSDKDIIAIFAPADPLDSAMPATYVDASAPPMLLIHGRKDTIVALTNLTRMQQKIEQAGGTVQTRIYDTADHIDTAAALSIPLRSSYPVLQDVSAFFARHR
ncbi:MAG: hypothetical protein CMM94_05105 [Rickettsiales bacterium]|nr:hypothetical protein [Rickettsiales bacterium]